MVGLVKLCEVPLQEELEPDKWTQGKIDMEVSGKQEHDEIETR